MPVFSSRRPCRPRLLDRPGSVLLPTASTPVRPFPPAPPLPAASGVPAAGEDVAFSAVDSARLRKRAAAYRESVVTGGAASERKITVEAGETLEIDAELEGK